MPVGPEEKSHTLVCALLLQFLKLGESLDLREGLGLGCRVYGNPLIKVSRNLLTF